MINKKAKFSLKKANLATLFIIIIYSHFDARSECNNNDWTCDNGQCISDNKLCDGKVDCRDQSDEIAENCIHFQETCQNFTFRCSYGACIDEKDELICTQKEDLDFQGGCFATEIQCVNSKECINSIDLCNGRVDCKDGSDESLELCINFPCIGFKCGYGGCISRNAKCNGIKDTTRKNTRCYIPNIPKLKNLIIKSHTGNETIPLGSFVDKDESIYIECPLKYTLRGKSSLLCESGKWNFNFPSCRVYCDGTLLRGDFMIALCVDKSRKEPQECPERIRPGTTIQNFCLSSYLRIPNFPEFIKCLPDGSFDYTPQPCCDIDTARSQCNNNDWTCDNDQCISDNKLCDGKADCSDQSDEIAENCIHFYETCRNFTFRCSYGACIDEKARCNGVQDCADNSDELICSQIDDSDIQGYCFATEIQCVNSKECINAIDLCNGRIDCKDGSDESLELCINFHCIGFKCGYGGCISRNAKCNGLKECADGSDEAWQLCNTPRKTNNVTSSTQTPIPKPTPITIDSDKKCIIPNIPQLQHLIFQNFFQNETIPLGSHVAEDDIISIKCKEKPILIGAPSLFCQNGKWNSDFPSCEDYCDGTLLRGLSKTSICNYGLQYFWCPDIIRPGTKIELNCRFGFTSNPNERQFIKCLPDGTFDKSPLHCQHNCGKVAPYPTALSKHGIAVKTSLAPWHVSINVNNSVNYNYICSGSIVSPRIIITAANCFWNEQNLTLRNYAEYEIIAGQKTPDHDDYLQIVKVEEIHIPQNYRGKNGHQRDDIAFVRLKTGLQYTETIASICLPKEIQSIASNYLPSGRKGFITRFGLYNQLKRFKMITLAYHDCIQRSPPDDPVASDKFCLIYSEVRSECTGDNGAAFFTINLNSEDDEIVHILQGVVSNTLTTTNYCKRVNDDSYVAATNIHYMPLDFKRKLLNAIKEDQALF